MEEEEYNRREVILPSLIPVVPEPELERETGERRGRDIIIAVDHGPNTQEQTRFSLGNNSSLPPRRYRSPCLKNQVVYDTTQVVFARLNNLLINTISFNGLVKSKARIVEGDAGKAICKEAERLKPAAVVLGTRGQSLMKSVLHGSVSEYCFHNCKTAPVIIVPGKEAGEESVV